MKKYGIGLTLPVDINKRLTLQSYKMEKPKARMIRDLIQALYTKKNVKIVEYKGKTEKYYLVLDKILLYGIRVQSYSRNCTPKQLIESTLRYYHENIPLEAIAGPDKPEPPKRRRINPDEPPKRRRKARSQGRPTGKKRGRPPKPVDKPEPPAIEVPV